MGSMSILHWLAVLLVVILIFGTKKLRNVGQDLGGAVKGFKEGLKDAADAADKSPAPSVEVNAGSATAPKKTEGRAIEGEATKH